MEIEKWELSRLYASNIWTEYLIDQTLYYYQLDNQKLGKWKDFYKYL